MRKIISTRGFTPLEIKSYLVRKRLSDEAYQDTIRDFKSNRARFLTGFTIFELIAVIAIILTIAGLLLAAISKINESSQMKKAKATIEQLEAALEMYAQDWGTYPNDDWSDFDGTFLGCYTLINALESETPAAKEKGGPYVRYSRALKSAAGDLIDPFGKPYLYHWSTYPTTANPTRPHAIAVGQGNGVNVPNITYNLWSTGPDETDNSDSPNPNYPEPAPPDIQQRYDDIISW